MIRNRLAILLAERGIKITKASQDTGISRNSLTAIAQNSSEMIRVDTINTLCKYLGITPNDFYEFIPFDSFFEVENIHLDLKVSRVDPYATEDFFKIENLNGELIFTIESINYRKQYELHFATNDNIIFPLAISNNITRGIEINIEFKNPLDHTQFFGAIGQYYYSNFFNQMNHSLVKQKIDEALINSLMRTYFNKYELPSYYDEQHELAFKEYVFIRSINSSFIKPF